MKRQNGYFLDLSDTEVKLLLSRPIPRGVLQTEWPGGDTNLAASPLVASLLGEINTDIRDGGGYCIVRIGPELLNDPHLLTVAYWNLFTCLGVPIPQYSSGEMLFEVQVSREAVPLMSHYSQSNRGGGFHTDGTFLTRSPYYVGLICLDQAKYGGDSILIDARPIYRELMLNQPEVLRSLEREFYFDCCGQISGKDTRLKPVISRKNGSLFVQYLRSYITQGHEKVAVPLTAEAVAGLDAFDEMLDRKEFQFLYKLNPGEMLLFNNSIILHGRKPFSEEGDEVSKRLLIRIYAEDPRDEG